MKIDKIMQLNYIIELMGNWVLGARCHCTLAFSMRSAHIIIVPLKKIFLISLYSHKQRDNTKFYSRSFENASSNRSTRIQKKRFIAQFHFNNCLFSFFFSSYTAKCNECKPKIITSESLLFNDIAIYINTI